MVVLLVLVLIVSVLLFYLYPKRPSNYPPGPKPLPVIGNYHQLPDDNTNFYLAVKQLSSQYGPIIGLSLGQTLLVLVDGADNVLDALRKEEFQGRPDMLSFRVRTREKNLGIFFSQGEQWASSRKFVMRNLKGYGKNRNENLIADEIERLVDIFQDGSIIKGTGIFSLSALNVIWRMVANKRLDLEDQVMKRFLDNIRLFFRQGNAAGNDIVNIFPLSRHFSSKFKFADRVVVETRTFIKEAIEEYQDVLDPNNNLDLMDYYLVEMNQRKDNTLFSGQRQCVGEVFARNTIFLFVTTFFERFSISLPPGEPRPSTLPQPGLTTCPQPFNILIKSRY